MLTHKLLVVYGLISFNGGSPIVPLLAAYLFILVYNVCTSYRGMYSYSLHRASSIRGRIVKPLLDSPVNEHDVDRSFSKLYCIHMVRV